MSVAFHPRSLKVMSFTHFFMDNSYAGVHVAAVSTTTRASKQSKCDNLPNVIHTVIVAVNPPYLADLNVYK